MLATVLHGQPTDLQPLLVAHGLFGSARNWAAAARRLADRRQVIAVDMRNHGDSPREPVQSYEAMADDLAAVIAAHGGRADVLGHSMGGKAAMVLALLRPELVARLIVADIAPVAYDHSQLPLVEAMQAVDLTRVRRRSDADALLADAVPDSGVRAFLLQSLAVGDGGAAWKLNLPVLAAEMPRIIGFPDLAGRFDGPTLFLTGAESDYVRPEHLPAIRARFPGAVTEALPGAGHWLHADALPAFVDAVRRFLAS